MTDKEFQELIKETHEAKESYQSLLYEAEQEYERRWGHNPSDVDDDTWIDSLHMPGDLSTWEEIKEGADFRGNSDAE